MNTNNKRKQQHQLHQQQHPHSADSFLSKSLPHSFSTFSNQFGHHGHHQPQHHPHFNENANSNSSNQPVFFTFQTPQHQMQHQQHLQQQQQHQFNMAAAQLSQHQHQLAAASYSASGLVTPSTPLSAPPQATNLSSSIPLKKRAVANNSSELMAPPATSANSLLSTSLPHIDSETLANCADVNLDDWLKHRVLSVKRHNSSQSTTATTSNIYIHF
jgi:hypothetical protein